MNKNEFQSLDTILTLKDALLIWGTLEQAKSNIMK